MDMLIIFLRSVWHATGSVVLILERRKDSPMKSMSEQSWPSEKSVKDTVP